jgi:Ca2+-binding RTX toxin-like protein
MALVIGKHAPYEYSTVVINYDDGVTDGADQILGTYSKDIIFAGGGNDIIKGGGGADTINGGEGRDGVTYEDSDTGVEVSLVTNTGKGGTAEGDKFTSIEDVYGSKFNDTLLGNSGDNLLKGGDGNDTLKGGGGTDVLDGGIGDDKMEIDGVEDHAHGGEGNDTLVVASKQGMIINLTTGFVDANINGQGMNGQYSAYSDWMGYNWPHPQNTPDQITGIENVVGSNYDDDIYGNAVANSLMGGAGNDLVSGRGGDDYVDGGSGSDFIYGGTGADTLVGGLDADRFIFTSLDDSKFTGGKPQDVITDFQHGQDKIDLSGLDTDNLLILDNQNVGGVNYSYVGIDANGDGQFGEGEFAIAVKMGAGATLHYNDLILF